MDVDTETALIINEANTDISKEDDLSDPIHDIIDYLVRNDDICFKSQQIGDEDLKTNDKKQIAMDVYKKGKLMFLERFGKHLKFEHLTYFENAENINDNDDITYHIAQLKLFLSANGKKFGIKNRRYEALSKMIKDTSYFSETEMMQRNPLLYEHLVGQYMTENEKKERDMIDTENITLLNVILEGIDRRHRKETLSEQKSMDETMEIKNNSDDYESDDDSEIRQKHSSWGEFSSNDDNKEKIKTKPKRKKSLSVFITAPERNLLKEEFIQEMYRSFLDGEDEYVDYGTIDNNTEYDCIDVRGRDEEEKYFDMESPENTTSENINNHIAEEQISKPEDIEVEESEDELDIYMKNLNRHSAIRNLVQVKDKS